MGILIKVLQRAVPSVTIFTFVAIIPVLGLAFSFTAVLRPRRTCRRDRRELWRAPGKPSVRSDHALAKRQGLTEAEREQSGEGAAGGLHRCVKRGRRAAADRQ
jgi:hypothetical protein